MRLFNKPIAFSSLIRQLNYYGFKKIKYYESIKIDKALEEETKDYSRFKHEYFRKGCESLLVNIRRRQQPTGSRDLTLTGSSPTLNEELNQLKEELDLRKDEALKLNDKLYNLTTEVKQMFNIDQNPIEDETDISVHTWSMPSKEIQVIASNSSDEVALIDDEALNDDELLNDDEASIDYEAFDQEAFVDELNDILENTEVETNQSSSLATTVVSVTPENTPDKGTSLSILKIYQQDPDLELMNKLSDALTILPNDIQELFLSRLIATIECACELKENLDSTGYNDEIMNSLRCISYTTELEEEQTDSM